MFKRKALYFYALHMNWSITTWSLFKAKIFPHSGSFRNKIYLDLNQYKKHISVIFKLLFINTMKNLEIFS